MKYFIDLSLLKHNRNFRLLYTGQFVSFIGTMITSVALPYQIYHETHSTFWVGMLGFFQLLPLLITALIGGVFADKHHRQKLLIISECFLALGCLLLAFNTYAQTTQIWIIFVIAAVMSGLTGLHRPAMDSITQQIVHKEDFSAVGSLANFRYSVGAIAGPALGGLIIAHYGLIITYLADLLTFIISLTALIAMPEITKPIRTYDEGTLASLKSGIRYAFSRQELIGTYAVDFLAMVFGMPMALFPAIAQNFGGVKALGLLYSAPAVGALMITFFSAWTNYIKRQGAAIALAASLWGLAIIFFGFSSHLFWALFFLVLAGAFDGISGIFRSMMWNQTIPQQFRGRLAGIEMISYLSGPRLGDTEAGLVAAAFSVDVSVISGGILCVLAVGCCCYLLPKFWRYEAE